jgi:hypothetical protein
MSVIVCAPSLDVISGTSKDGVRSPQKAKGVVTFSRSFAEILGGPGDVRRNAYHRLRTSKLTIRP